MHFKMSRVMSYLIKHSSDKYRLTIAFFLKIFLLKIRVLLWTCKKSINMNFSQDEETYQLFHIKAPCHSL